MTNCNCNWTPGTYSTLSDPTPRQVDHAAGCSANRPTIYLLITQLDAYGAKDHELYSERPTFRLIRGMHELYEGDLDGGDMRPLFPPPACHWQDCLNDGTISTMVDLDPADCEVGPQPDITEILACSQDHMENLMNEIRGL